MSSTLLRNMREKELKKAITFHMKKSQSLHDPKQRGLSVEQARVNYLEELSDLKSFGGKSFSATMMVGRSFALGWRGFLFFFSSSSASPLFPRTPFSSRTGSRW